MELGLWESSQHEKGSGLILVDASTTQPPVDIRTSTQTQQGERKKKKKDEIEENKLMNKSRGEGTNRKTSIHWLTQYKQATTVCL